MPGRTWVYGIAVVLAAGAACLDASAPGGFVLQYGIGIYACDPLGCETPDTVAVNTAAPGDTVWVRHEVLLLQAVDTIQEARVRPACAENVIVRSGSTTVQSLPEPAACPDSTASQEFVLGVPVRRFTQWVLDPSLTASLHAVVGRMIVQPRLEPTVAFTVQ